MSCKRKSEVPECQTCQHAHRGGRAIDPLLHKVENSKGQVVRKRCLSYRELKHE